MRVSDAVMAAWDAYMAVQPNPAYRTPTPNLDFLAGDAAGEQAERARVALWLIEEAEARNAEQGFALEWAADHLGEEP